jgi:RAB protein geranylgeranyltransferase component A
MPSTGRFQSVSCTAEQSERRIFVCYRAAAKQGKTVLHLDPANYYGSLWTSFQLDQFLDWCKSHGSDKIGSTPPASADAQPLTQPSASSIATHASQDSAREEAASAQSASAADNHNPSVSEIQGPGGDGFEHTSAASSSSAQQMSVLRRPVAETGRIYMHAEVHRAEGADLGPSREYNIDLAPRVRLFFPKISITM